MENFMSLPPEVQEALLNRAAQEPPSGLESNFDNPDNSNAMVIAVMAVCLVIIVISGFLRFYSRVFVLKRVALEDYLGLAAYGSFFVMIWVMLEYKNTGGFLVHQWNIRMRDLFHILYILVVLRISYCLLMIFAKTAILLEWTRIFVPRGTKNAFFWATQVAIWTNILVYILAIILTMVSCIPTEKIWEPWLEGRCFNRRAMDIFTAAFNLTMDLYILLLPQRFIWTLNLSRSSKAGVSAVFSIGLVIVACAAGRLGANIMLDYGNDTSYMASINLLWAFVEMSMVLVVFCAPGIPKAFSGHRALSRIRSSLRTRSSLSGPTSQKQKDTFDASSDGSLSRSKGARDIQVSTDIELTITDAEAGLGDREAGVRSQSSMEPIINHQHPWA